MSKYKALAFVVSLFLETPAGAISLIPNADITYVVRRSDGSPFLTNGWQMDWKPGWEQWNAVNLEERVILRFLKDLAEFEKL